MHGVGRLRFLDPCSSQVRILCPVPREWRPFSSTGTPRLVSITARSVRRACRLPSLTSQDAAGPHVGSAFILAAAAPCCLLDSCALHAGRRAQPLALQTVSQLWSSLRCSGKHFLLCCTLPAAESISLVLAFGTPGVPPHFAEWDSPRRAPRTVLCGSSLHPVCPGQCHCDSGERRGRRRLCAASGHAEPGQ